MAHPSHWRHDRRQARQSPSVSGGSWSDDDTDKGGPGHKPAESRRPYSPVAETVSQFLKCILSLEIFHHMQFSTDFSIIFSKLIFVDMRLLFVRHIFTILRMSCNVCISAVPERSDLSHEAG